MTHRKLLFLKKGGLALLSLAILALVFLVVPSVDKFTDVNLLQKETTLAGDILPYVLAEQYTTNLPSRKWMTHTIEIAKHEGFSQPVAARYFAYVASVYADVIDKTDSTEQASLASAELLKSFFPNHKNDTNAVLDSLGSQDSTLLPEAALILQYYIDRSKNDNFHLVWDREISGENKWYIRNKETDDGAMAKEWKPWIIGKNTVSIPHPPARKSYRDKLELEKVIYAIEHRTPEDEEIIFFWEGIDNFLRPTHERKSIALAGIWQNILFIEAGDFTTDVYGRHRDQQTRAQGLDDITYARYQKVLAQGIADALIATWRAKYTFFTQRPSMRIPHLKSILRDPPFPAYISEHAAASAAAAVILTAALPPEKENRWLRHAKNAGNSRLLAGVNFDTDNKAGTMAGEIIGRAAVEKLFESAKIPQITLEKNINRSAVAAIKDLVLIVLQRNIVDIKRSIATLVPFKNNLSNPAFVNVAEESGLAMRSRFGASWGDYNSDGNLDLITANGLYRNEGDGTFTFAKVSGEIKAPAVFGDYNNDGCPDIYVVRAGHARYIDTKGIPDLLYKNNCDGTFTDVTAQAGLYDSYHGVSASWADYNNDGYLDIYVLNWGVLLGDALDDLTIPYKFEPNVLYRNNGDGTFTNVTDEAGADGILDCDEYITDPNGLRRKMKVPWHIVWFDYNNDNRIDLFLVSDSFTSPLYKNNGDGTFAQVTRASGLCAHERKTNMGAAIGDYDGNGFLDIYVTNAGDNFLWRNNGDGTFTDVAKETGANNLGYGWGTEPLDFDNDGDLDIVVVNGHNRLRARYYYVAELKHNDLDELLSNNGDGTFSQVGELEGLVHGNKVTYSVAVADYNNDGFPDIFIPVPGERHLAATSLLYKNQGNNNHWITIQLIGTQSNRDGIGARITINSGDKTQIREVITGASFVAQSSPWPTFGLGKSERVDTLTIRWPSGIIQTIEDVPIDQKITVKEWNSTTSKPANSAGLQ